MTKLLSILFLMAAPIFAQVTITINVPGEGATTMIWTQDFATILPAWMQTIAPSLSTGPISLSAPMTAEDTTLNLANNSITGLAPGMGLLIDPNTSIAEVVLVVSLSPLVIQRGMISTTAGAHLAGATVNVMMSGSYGQFIKNLVKNSVADINLSKPSALVAAQKANIAAANATIQATQAASVQ